MFGDYSFSFTKPMARPHPDLIKEMMSWADDQGIEIAFDFSTDDPPWTIFWHFKTEKDMIAFSIRYALGC